MGVKRKPLVVKLYNGPYEDSLVRRLEEEYVIISAKTTGETYAFLNLNPDAIIIDTASSSSLVVGDGNIRCSGIEALIESTKRPFFVPNRIAVVPESQMISYSKAHIYGTCFARPKNGKQGRKFAQAIATVLQDRFKSFERAEVNPQLYVLVGPSAAGKNTIIKGLSEATKGGVVLCPKYTTREPRPPEKPGSSEWKNFTEYSFVTPKVFEELCTNEDILRYTLYKNEYGISLDLLNSALKSGRDVIVPTASLELMKSLENKFGENYGVVPILLHPPIELILYRLAKRIGERALEQNREEEIRAIHAEHAKRVSEFPYVFSYHLDKARRFEEMQDDEKKRFIEKELNNVGNRLLSIHSHEKKMQSEGIVVRGKHEKYVDGICTKFVNLSFAEMQKRVRERGRIELPMCRGAYVVSTGISHGRAVVLIEPHPESTLYEIIGKIMGWLKSDDNCERFFYDEQQDVRYYDLPQKSSLMGLARIKDRSGDIVPVVDALFYTLTDCFPGKTDDGNAAGLVLSFLTKKYDVPLSIIPLEDDELEKEQRAIVRERSQHIQNQERQPTIRRSLI